MGNCIATPKTSLTDDDGPRFSIHTANSPSPKRITKGELRNYKLRKRKPGRSGMFWRADPTGKTRLLANSDWPRDGAIVQGESFEAPDGAKWLKAHKVKQVGQRWVNAPEGAFLPFEYDNHYYLQAVM